MDPTELTLGLALALLLIGIAGYFALRQLQTFRLLRADARRTPDGTNPEAVMTDQTFRLLRADARLPHDDRRFLHQQAIRRLTCSVLMFALAGFLIGWFFLQPDFDALRPAVEGEPLPEEAKESLRFLTFYWIFALFLFLAVMALALLDLMATTRYGRQKQKQLEQHRREVLAAEAARFQDRRHELN